ncbi:MAG: hypothetical protein ACREJ3_16550, partial [Polyangiaceae bacterium]
MQKVAIDYAPESPEASVAVCPPSLEASVGAALSAIIERLRAWIVARTDGQMALLIGAVLFLLTAWPVALVDVPPFQDLPNHLATAHIIQHLDKYPEFVFNGYFKT